MEVKPTPQSRGASPTEGAPDNEIIRAWKQPDADRPADDARGARVHQALQADGTRVSPRDADANPRYHRASAVRTRVGSVAVARIVAVALGAITMVTVVFLLMWDAVPGRFPAHAHDILGALPLALIAISYLVYQAVRRPAFLEFLKAVMLAAAFLSWAANQLLPTSPHATLFNDIAIVLFVVDVFLVIIGWPPGSKDEGFADSDPAERDSG